MLRWLFLGLGIAASPLAAQSTDSLGWMAGDWVEAGAGGLTEESWLSPRGGLMLGRNRAGMDGGRLSFEFTRIADGPDGRPVFHAQPGGAPPSAFPAVEVRAQSVTFENRAHDYPQRIRYWRDGDLLMAEISLADGTRPVRWQFGRRR